MAAEPRGRGRRPNHAGSVYRIGTGRQAGLWRGAVMLPDGKRKHVSGQTREEVEGKIVWLLAALDQGRDVTVAGNAGPVVDVPGVDVVPPTGWYLYVLRSPQGGVFYVGQGAGRRAWQHEQRARRGAPGPTADHIRQLLLAGHPIQVVIIACFATAGEARQAEQRLIGAIGVERLTNSRFDRPGWMTLQPWPGAPAPLALPARGEGR